MHVLDIIASGIAYVAIGVIIWGGARTLVRGVVLEFTKCRDKHTCCEREGLRREFGSYLLLALEFLIAADVVSSISKPTLMEMALLGSIVVIRTVISFFLNRELQLVRLLETASEAQTLNKGG
jgi:uncharacterized membrane protein